MGEKFIGTYYDHHHPFDQMTVLGLETEERMTLPDGNHYHVKIDKLACIGDTYYVCDYKTNSRMKDQGDADGDRQLAMYSIWVKDKFKDAKKVVLLWHMLAFDKEVTSERTDKQLQKLTEEVTDRIKEIEGCTAWPTNVTALCDYCKFKSICPSFKHEFELEEKTVEEFKDDDGVKLVNEYAELDAQEREIKQKKENTKQRLISFSEQKGVDVVYGSNKKVSVKEYEKIAYPEDIEGFVKLLKEKGVYENVIILSYPKLNSLIQNKKVDQEIINQTKTEKAHRISLSSK
jgi:hypothetical protein